MRNESPIIESMQKKVNGANLPDRDDIVLLAQENPILHRVLNLCYVNRNDCTWEETMHLAIYHLIRQNNNLVDDMITLRNKFGFNDLVFDSQHTEKLT